LYTVALFQVSIEELSEKIEAFGDFVQSVDVAAMNKN
jgi:FtsZ-binding cell division protein ZapB